MSDFGASYNLPAPRRITASNLPLPSHLVSDPYVEPGVEVRDEKLVAQPLLDGSFRRAVIATSSQVPTKNDGHDELKLDAVPGAGIVLPGGLNTYYLDIAPQTEGALHRTTSTDYVIVLSGKLSLLTPKADAYHIKDGKATCASDLVTTVALPGDVIYQRGTIHSLSNNTNEWVRALCIVVGSETNKVPLDKGSGYKELADQWLV
ncbi:cupin 2 [Akanthomyces lecanii RCEF 1005]|uniref:Cupin 2 n=1 Tax=Akanthomyces lecanii RCEF 1005 TaxID=1081108 RepID=A0A167T359_CORDF|nr:cupin 2 [Akanthomyces lecanii RCEF 1005]